MNHILIACADFTTISGMPMFNYDLGKELVARGKRVTLAAPNVGGTMARRGRDAGIECATFDQARGLRPDVLHVQGVHPAHWAIHTFPRVPAVATVHSRLIYETPYLHDNIKKYACVRPEILDKIISVDNVPWAKTTVVYNGVDFERFTPSDDKFDIPTILFAGTVDYLRAQASQMVIDIAEKRGWNVMFVGRRLSGHLNELPPHVSHMDGDLWDIELTTRKCTATAGILLGRTTLEGWACGIPGFVFEIDNEGIVQSWGEYAPPPPSIMRQFDIRFMVDTYERLYEAAHV